MSAVLESSVIASVLGNLPTAPSKGKGKKKRSETASTAIVNDAKLEDKQTVPHPAIDNLDAKGKAERDQQLATERDKLIADGHKLAGVGQTAERVNYGVELVKYARIMAHHCRAKSDAHMWNTIETIAKGINSEGNGQATDYRDVYEYVDMSTLATFIPHVKLMNYSIAKQFLRFVADKSLTNPAMKSLDAGKELASKIIKRDASLLTTITKNRKESFIDRKKVKLAIDALLGKRKGPQTDGADDTDGDDDDEAGTSGVTSVHAVANWLKVADSAKYAELMKLLGTDASKIAESLISAI